MEVPYADLKTQFASLREEVLAALDRVGSKAAFILGEEVEEFEREFAPKLTELSTDLEAFNTEPFV